MLFLSALLACGPACFSQQAEKFPLGDYVELTDTPTRSRTTGMKCGVR